MAEEKEKLTEDHVKNALQNDKYAQLPPSLKEAAEKADKQR